MFDAEQKVVERAFLTGNLRVLVSTSALGEGVNLPVHTVIHTSLKLGKEQLTALKFRQMSGRAGKLPT